jgi:hypothetical protein
MNHFSSKDLKQAFEQLVQGIKDYESDTFSGGALSQKEAETLAMQLWLDVYADLGYGIDGVHLSHVYDELC